MGYYAHSTKCDIRIKNEKEETLRTALYNWLTEGRKSWISTERALQTKDIERLIQECRYYASKNDDYIEIEHFEGEKWGATDNEFPTIIAPFVENGCVLSFRGEDDCLWRYRFNNGACVEELGSMEEVWKNNN